MDLRSRATAERKGGGSHAAQGPKSATPPAAADNSKLRMTFDNLFWMISAFAVLYFSNFASVVLFDSSVHSVWFWLSVTFFVTYLTIVIYIYKRKPHVLGSTSSSGSPPWELMLATFTGIATGLCFTVSVWPVWSYYTLLIVPTLFMGLVSTVAIFNL